MQIQDVDLRLLRVFVAIVECGGLSAAEARLNIGRSTISTHLADLETRLKVPLCTRGRAGFKISEQGKTVYEASLALFQQCELFVSTVADTESGLSGRLSISIIDMTISDHRCRLSEAIARIKSRGGNVQIDLNVRAPDDLELSVLNGQSNLGIGVSRHALRGLQYEPLYEEETYLYCSLTHPLFDCTKKETAGYLKNSEFVSRGYMRGSDSFGIKLPCKTTASAFHEEGIAHLILSGQYIGYLPEQFAKSWVDQGKMKAIIPGKYFYKTPVVLMTSKSTQTSNLVSTFLDDIRDLYS